MHEPLCPRIGEKPTRVTLKQEEWYGGNKGVYVGEPNSLHQPLRDVSGLSLEEQQKKGGPLELEGQDGLDDLLSKAWVNISIN